MAEELFALTLHAPPPSEADYDVIFAAVMESERGRRFLTEYARRNRHADTQLLLGAINRIAVALRLQSPMVEPVMPAGSETRALFEVPSLRAQLTQLIETIAKARAVLGTIEPEDARIGKIADFDSAARLLRDLENRFSAMLARADKPARDKQPQPASAKPMADVSKKPRAQPDKVAAPAEPVAKRKSSLPASAAKGGSRGPALRIAGKPDVAAAARDRSAEWKPEAIAPLEPDMPPQVLDKMPALTAAADDDVNLTAFLFGSDAEPASAPAATAASISETQTRRDAPRQFEAELMPTTTAAEPARDMPTIAEPVTGPADFLLQPWPHEPASSEQPKTAASVPAAPLSKTDALLQLAERFKFDVTPKTKAPPGKLEAQKLLADIARALPVAKPAAQPLREEALAPINALSDEEKIALFS
jgi:hypothetical protein